MTKATAKTGRPALSVRAGKKYVNVSSAGPLPAQGVGAGTTAGNPLRGYLAAKNPAARRRQVRLMLKGPAKARRFIGPIRDEQHRLASRVARLLRAGVPPYPSDKARVWEGEVRRVGRNAEVYFLDALSGGTPSDQYAALIALRTLGYDAWAEGYDEDLVYRVRRDKSEVVIVPSSRSHGRTA